MGDVLRAKLARVKTEHGLHVLHRGETIPDDALDGEKQRLVDLGEYGERFKTPDEVAAEKLAAERDAFEADVEAEAGASEETKPDAPDADADADQEAIDAFVADATVDDIVAAADGNPELAQKYLDAEQELRGSDSRSTLVEALEAITEG